MVRSNDLEKSQKHYEQWHKAVNIPVGGGIHPVYEKFHGWLLGGREFGNEKVLDVACGSGFLLHWLKERFPIEPYGLDFSRLALARVKKFVPSAHTLLAPAEKIPTSTNTFDFVTCIGSLEHFIDIEGALKEMLRVTKPGGKALFYVPNLFFVGHIWFGLTRGTQPSEGEQDFSERYFTYGGWKALIEQAGWKINEVRYYNWILYTAKVPRFVRALYNFVFRPFVPKNFSYAFAFYVTKLQKRSH